MADVITRFKLETTQYDSALRDASQGLAKLTQQLQMAGKDFSTFADKHVEAARALGQVESGATKTRDKLRDLVNAYNNVAKSYNNLTEEQKKSDFGKAMAGSLEQLQQRIKATKKELDEMGTSNKNASGGADALTAALGRGIMKMGGWAAAIAAGKKGLDVLKDAFFASEENIDTWGSMLESGSAVYEGFLTALNTGDISGYLNNINEIVKAAEEAYNALDYLNTTKTINAPATSERQAEISRLQTMLRTGRAVNSLTGGKNYAEEGKVLTDQQRKAVADDLKALMKEARDTVKSEVSAANSAIDALYNEQAKVLGMSAEEFRRGTANMTEFNKRVEGARRYRQFEAAHTTTTVMNTSAGPITTTVRDNAVNPDAKYSSWSHFKDGGPMFQRLVQEIQKRDAAQQQYYGLVSQSYRGINRADGVRTGTTGGGTTVRTPATKEMLETVTYPAGSIPQLTQQLKELKDAQQQALNGQEWQDYQREIDAVAVQLDAMKGNWKEGLVATFSVDINNSEAYDLLKGLAGTEVDDTTIRIKADTAEAYNNIQQLLSGIEEKTVEFSLVPDTKNLSVASNDNIRTFLSDLQVLINQAPLGSELYANLTSKLRDVQAFKTIMEAAVKAGIDMTEFDPDGMWREILTEDGNIPNKTWRSILDSINEQLRAAKFDPIKLKVKLDYSEDDDDDDDDGGSNGSKSKRKKKNGNQDVDDTGDGERKKGLNVQALGKLTSNVSSIASGIEMLGIELPAELHSVLNVLNGITTILTAINSMTTAEAILPFGFSGGGVVHAAGGFSGIVPGNSFSGDNIPALLNSGESVLTRAQAGILDARLATHEEGGFGGGVPYVSGEQIFLGLNNYLRRTGRGELLTANR